MNDSSSICDEDDKMWGVENHDRIVIATNSAPRSPSSLGCSHSLQSSHQSGEGHAKAQRTWHAMEREEPPPRELLPSLKKAYLLPKDHALHIPPHVALSRLEDDMEALAADLRELHHRNYEKDKGKQFEGSYTRVGFIMVITYFTLCAYMAAIGVGAPFLNAIVPTVGFNLSTWSLPWVKQIWMGFYDYNWGRPVEVLPPPTSPLEVVGSGRV